MTTHKQLDDHIEDDRKTHGELRKTLDTMQNIIRRWALVGGLMGGILGHAIHALEGCSASLPGRPTQQDLATYQAEQTACVLDYSTRETIDVCRAKFRADWCARFPSEVNCPKDAGAE